MWWSDAHKGAGAGAEPARRRSVSMLTGVVAAAALGVSACGFALRQPARVSFTTIALSGFAPRSLLVAALRRQLEQQQVQVLEDPARAALVLQALDEQRDRIAVASTSAAQVRELQLRLKLRFRAYAPNGRELIVPTDLLVARDLSYRETAALAKEFEEQELFREMQTDLVAQVLRRLAAVAV